LQEEGSKMKRDEEMPLTFLDDIVKTVADGAHILLDEIHTIVE